MELMFNELSMESLSSNKYEAIEKAKQFASTFSAARRKGFKRIRSANHSSDIKLTQDYSLQDFLFEKSSLLKDYQDILFGNINQPFINEEDEEVENKYILSNFHYDNNGTKQECLGLSAAFFYDTLSISLNSSILWRINSISIVNDVDEVVTIEQVNNVFSNVCYDTKSISDFVEYLGDVELIITSIIPSEKKIHLADHHGKKELKKLCNRLINSEYVIEMRSTDWGGKDFIRKINKEGVIEIVLVNSQREYALWVQTTGRNYRETEAIAENLKERYS